MFENLKCHSDIPWLDFLLWRETSAKFVIISIMKGVNLFQKKLPGFNKGSMANGCIEIRSAILAVFQLLFLGQEFFGLA